MFKSGYITIVGQPNVGKSTLLNQLVGESVAIVTPKPQTTRQRIVGILNRPNAQLLFLDTPGYHILKRAINSYMCDVVAKCVEEADVACLLIDPFAEVFGPDEELYERIRGKHPLVVINKADKLTREKWDGLAEEWRTRLRLSELFFISALTGDGVKELIEAVTQKMPEGEPFYPPDLYTPLPVRFLASEIVREQAILHLHQEIPYGLAVETEKFEEKKGITVIEAALIVDRSAHKKIVIGAGGQMVKAIGTQARKKIEKLVGQKVYLELFVKVEEDWTKDPNKISRFLHE